MAITTSGGSSIYPIGLPVPNSGQTLVSAAFQNKGAGEAVYTVPAGKTFYMLGFAIAAAGLCGIVCGGNTFVSNTSAAGTFTIVSSVPIATAAAGATVNVAGYVNGNNGSVWGFTQ